ncbi:MAG: hypothetical protein CR994_04885 [Maribacter sp.]|nr:MAG: hypothetical protein CR994_04885 [Maribacter sp.]
MPDNVALLFLPPYSPEPNPAERIWWRIKNKATNIAFPSQEKHREFLSGQAGALTKETIIPICDFQYYRNANHLWSIL